MALDAGDQARKRSQPLPNGFRTLSKMTIAARLLLRSLGQITQKGGNSLERPANSTAYCNAQKRRSLIVGLNHFEAMAP